MMRPRKLHIAGVIIMLSWFTTVGWQVHRVYFSAAPPGNAAAAARLAPGGRFYAVYAGGRQVGTASLTSDTTESGVRLSERLDWQVDDSTTEHHALDLDLSPTLALRDWSYALSGVPHAVAVSGTHAATGRFELRLTRAGGDTVAMTIDAGNALPVFAALLRRVLMDPPRRRDSLYLRLLDPRSGELARVPLRVGTPQRFVVPDSARYDSPTERWVPAHADTIEAWPVVETGTFYPLRIWVDAEGFPVRAVLPNGLVLDRTAFEISLLNFRDGHPATLGEAPAHPPWSLLSTFPDPVLPSDTMASLAFPATEAIRRAANAALQGSTTREASIRRVARWAARKATSAAGADGLPDAVTGRWSALGRARAVVAVMRAAGLPARLSVAADPTPAGWSPRLVPEVFTDGWHPVDPVHGRFPADSAPLTVARRVTGQPADYSALLLLLPEPRP